VSRRRRAVAFGVAALVCAGLAANVATRYRSSVEAQYGGLRPVLVATSELAAGQPIGPKEIAGALAVRRVPARFAPPGSLRRPQDALGQAPGVTIPAGSYVLAAQLAVPSPEPPPTPGAAHGLRPVQVEVTGAEALLVGGASPEGTRVDVVVSRQSGLGDDARTYIAAEDVQLLALRGPKAAGEGWSATLALSRDQALDLIEAEAGARQIRLLPRP
jgi:Flp pilus assembly protein CpaB